MEPTTANPVTNDVNQFNQLDSRKKFTIIGIIAVLFVASVFVGSMINKKSDDTAQKTTEETTSDQGAAQSVLAIMPKEATLAVGKTQTFEVTLSQTPVAAVDIVVSYDPSVLQLSNVKNGTAFPSVIQNKFDGKTLVFSSSVAATKKDATSSGKVLTFDVTAKKKATSTLLEFVQGETITAVNGENTLGTATGAMIKVQ